MLGTIASTPATTLRNTSIITAPTRANAVRKLQVKSESNCRCAWLTNGTPPQNTASTFATLGESAPRSNGATCDSKSFSNSP